MIAASLDGGFDLVECAEEDFVLARDTESHVAIVLVAVGESTAGNTSHAFTDQHLIESDCVRIAIRNPGPHVESGSGVVDLEPNPAQRFNRDPSLLCKLLAQHVVVIGI